MKISNSIAELRQQIHHDLRVQHPERVEPSGESAMCDSYEARLTELLLPARPFVDFQKRVDGNLEGKSSTKGQKS
jgi:hypothetical protein